MTEAQPIIRMRGAGYYSEHTTGAKQVIDRAIPLALEALAGMDVKDEGSVFAIADYGAADGGTSIGLHRALIQAVRTRASGRAITVTHTDLPHNDFSNVFRLMHGLGGEPAVTDADGVFSFASGASFYRQIFPDSTVSFGFSATAMHWLSRLPESLGEHVHACGVQGAPREAFRRQALADWESILLMRARELAPGGRLVLANFCEDAAGHYLGWTGGRNMHDCFAQHWLALQHAGIITAEEFARATFPQYYKTEQEFLAPLADPQSPVRRAGLRLEQSFTVVTPCPYAAQLQQGLAPADFAHAYVPTLRSWSESTFLGALATTRPMEERQHIVNRFYQAYEDAVAAAPEGHAMDYVHCFMVLSKA